MAHSPSVRLNGGITAYPTGGNTNAVSLVIGAVNIVSTAAAHGDSVILPVAPVGSTTSIKNDGAKDVAIFPPSGGTVDGLAANAAYQLSSGSSQIFLATETNTFIALRKTQRNIIRVVSSLDINGNANFNANTTVYHGINMETYGMPPSSRGKHVHVVVHVGDSGGDGIDISGVGGNSAIVDRIHTQFAWSCDHYIHAGPCNAAGYMFYHQTGVLDNGVRFSLGGWITESA